MGVTWILGAPAAVRVPEEGRRDDGMDGFPGVVRERLRQALAVVALLCLLPGCATGAVVRSGTAPAPAMSAAPTLVPIDLPASPVATATVGPPTSGDWIEVDLARQVVRLHEDGTVAAEYAAATGAGTRPEFATYPGLFQITQKYRGPEETAPGVYVTYVLLFDVEHGNGFHSLPMDKDGHVLDDRLGQPISAGCVRVGEAEALYDFARAGMKVWVH